MFRSRSAINFGDSPAHQQSKCLTRNRHLSQTVIASNGVGGHQSTQNLDRVLSKIKDSQRKQIKVIQANLAKKDRNEVTMAMFNFKAKKAEETAKEMLENKVYNIKERNEWQAEKVAKRKAMLEAEKLKKQRELHKKEKFEMSPLKLGNTAPMRTFNASATHFMPSQMQRSSMRNFKMEMSMSKREALEQEHASTIDSRLLAVENKMELSKTKKQAKLKETIDSRRSQNENPQQRLDQTRHSQESKLDLRRRQFDLVNQKRNKRLQNELDEQSYNFWVFKEDKMNKQEKFDKRKTLVKTAEEQYNQALREKIEQQRDVLEYQRDMVKFNQLMKQEMRQLKQQDQLDLQNQQNRIKMKQKMSVAQKKILSDEVKIAEAQLRDNFVKKIQ